MNTDSTKLPENDGLPTNTPLSQWWMCKCGDFRRLHERCLGCDVAGPGVKSDTYEYGFRGLAAMTERAVQSEDAPKCVACVRVSNVCADAEAATFQYTKIPQGGHLNTLSVRAALEGRPDPWAEDCPECGNASRPLHHDRRKCSNEDCGKEFPNPLLAGETVQAQDEPNPGYWEQRALKAEKALFDSVHGPGKCDCHTPSGGTVHIACSCGTAKPCMLHAHYTGPVQTTTQIVDVRSRSTRTHDL